MAKSPSFNRQFRGGYFPKEKGDDYNVLNGPEVSTPSKIRKRQGVSLGSQVEARPGMQGKNDDSTRMKKDRR